MIVLCVNGQGYSCQLFSQTLTYVLLWRYFIDCVKVHSRLTLSEIILDNMCGPDLISWKPLGAEQASIREKKLYL